MSKLITHFLALGVAILSGCLTSEPKATVNYPLPFIEKAIQISLGRVKTVSQNRREFVSEYLTKEGRIWDPLGNDIQRVVITVYIIGDRRPYDIDIESSVEERPTNKPGYSAVYTVIGKSPRLEQEMNFRIQNYLRQNSKRNLIDDFRPF